MNKKVWTVTKGAAVTAVVLMGLVALLPQPAAALFGVGDIVFDPSSMPRSAPSGVRTSAMV